MNIEYKRTLPVRLDVDVFVAGGGPAGTAAAVTAARAGARVFLAESLCTFGGIGTCGGIPFICRPTDGINFLCAGFGEEIYDRLFEAGGAAPEMVKGQHPADIGGFIYDPEVLKRIYDQVVTEAKVDFTFQTTLLDVVGENGTIDYAICAAKSGLFAVKAAIYIDATGDGDLCVRAGAPFEFGDEEGLPQASTLCTLWSGIDWTRKKIWTDGANIQKAIDDGVFTQPDPKLVGILRTRDDTGWCNMGHVFGINACDERSVTKGIIQGRKQAPEYEYYYRHYVPGGENAKMLWSAQVLGVRESRRIMGDYVLNVDDFVNRAIFDDEIGRYGYPIDLHKTKLSSNIGGDAMFDKYCYKKPGESYGIPYRVLTPKNTTNVLVAGRCVSMDRYMLGSLRVQAGCFITGQAAGMAAALAADKHLATRELPVAELQDNLVKIGAFLPNHK